MKHLFLDLEDTIITPVVNGWNDFDLINVSTVKQVIEEFKPDSVNVFSFAIANIQDITHFNKFCRPHIEKAIGLEFSFVPDVDNVVIPACCDILKLHKSRVDFFDASDFWSKQESFRLFMRSFFRNTWKDHKLETEVMLLDDAVINESFEFTDLRLKGRIIRV